MITFLVTTTEVGVVLIVMVQERRLAATGARRVLRGSWPRLRPVRRELMEAVTALILLKTKNIFAITIKVG